MKVPCSGIIKIVILIPVHIGVWPLHQRLLFRQDVVVFSPIVLSRIKRIHEWLLVLFLFLATVECGLGASFALLSALLSPIFFASIQYPLPLPSPLPLRATTITATRLSFYTVGRPVSRHRLIFLQQLWTYPLHPSTTTHRREHRVELRHRDRLNSLPSCHQD